MEFVTRDQRGAPKPKAAFTWVDSTRGVKVHYEGTAVPASLAAPDQHGRCAGRVNDIERSHLANTAEGYIAIAYSAMVCPHGTVYEGRGLHHLQAANGPGLNSQHYSVCGMVGDSGLTEPTAAQLNGIRDAIEWLQRNGGAGPEIKGHRDGYATDCPGGPLYRWVQAGAPRPSTPPVHEEIDMTPDQIAAAPILYRGLDGQQPPVQSNIADFLNNFIQSHGRIEATLAAQSAVMQALVTQLGQAHGVDTERVIAAVTDAASQAVAEYLADASITFRTSASPSN